MHCCKVHNLPRHRNFHGRWLMICCHCLPPTRRKKQHRRRRRPRPHPLKAARNWPGRAEHPRTPPRWQRPPRTANVCVSLRLPSSTRGRSWRSSRRRRMQRLVPHQVARCCWHSRLSSLRSSANAWSCARSLQSWRSSGKPMPTFQCKAPGAEGSQCTSPCGLMPVAAAAGRPPWPALAAAVRTQRWLTSRRKTRSNPTHPPNSSRVPARTVIWRASPTGRQTGRRRRHVGAPRQPRPLLLRPPASTPSGTGLRWPPRPRTRRLHGCAQSSARRRTRRAAGGSPRQARMRSGRGLRRRGHGFGRRRPCGRGGHAGCAAAEAAPARGAPALRGGAGCLWRSGPPPRSRSAMQMAAGSSEWAPQGFPCRVPLGSHTVAPLVHGDNASRLLWPCLHCACYSWGSQLEVCWNPASHLQGSAPSL
mmetsp:Transcript_138663/g.386699  ORF Transcript_138663/g.386699 Transcript_138663/m.386699 type:complete len:420 (-) Transcript_138663:228-1487(-)